MKNLILLLSSIALFLTGIIFKLIPLKGSGILLFVALALFVVYSAIRYFKTRGPVIRKILMISSGALIASGIIGMTGSRYFAEIILLSLILGVVIFVATLFYGENKKSEKKKT